MLCCLFNLESEHTPQRVELCILPLNYLGAKRAHLIIHLLLLLLDLYHLLKFPVIVEVCLNVPFVVRGHDEVGPQVRPQEFLVTLTLVDLDQKEDEEEVHRLQDEVVQVLNVQSSQFRGRFTLKSTLLRSQ